MLKMINMPLMPWQERFLVQLLAENRLGHWAAPEACLLVPRQNGKSYVLAARILAGLFLTGEELITYTAHRVDTALEVFNLVDRLARSHPDLEAQIKSTVRTGGKETLHMRSGARFKIVARARATGRGFTGDCLIMDEALELRDHAPINALLPTLATRPNAQLIYASSAGDKGSVVLASVRDRGVRESDPSLLFVEYAAERDADPDDEDQWLASNPGAPELITLAAIRRERARMSLDGFRQERLGIWAHELARAIIPPLVWQRSTRLYELPTDSAALSIAFDLATDRSHATIVVAQRTFDGNVHVRVSNHADADDWLVERLSTFAAAYDVPISYDMTGPGRDIADKLARADVAVDAINQRDFSTSCARLLSGLTAQTITHHPDLALDQAAEVAVARKTGELWTINRRHAPLPVTPLCAAALAVWALEHKPTPVVPRIW